MEFKEYFNEATRYGNYCGPGPELDKTCSKLADGSPLPNPINSVDATCKAHDISYCKCGANWMDGIVGRGSSCSKAADKDMISQIKKILPDLKGTQKLIAHLILQYFQIHAGRQP